MEVMVSDTVKVKFVIKAKFRDRVGKGQTVATVR
jgi:hypothetical protein